MPPRSQKERQPRLVRITLSPENYEALQREIEARGVREVTGAESVVLNEWITRGRSNVQPAPPASPPTLGPAEDDEGEFGFKL